MAFVSAAGAGSPMTPTVAVPLAAALSPSLTTGDPAITALAVRLDA